MSEHCDRLYDLLPVVYRRQDAETGYPLRALLQVIAEQVNLVEADIAQLYESWFIETCQDWVVPYIGDLVGYRIVHEAGEPGPATTARGRLRNKILIPRREVANTISYRRRKGTLALLELLSSQVAGWPARAVELYTLLAQTQAINHLRLQRGKTVDLRDGDALDCLGGPFDRLAHTVDVRSIASHRRCGRYNIPSVGLHVWRQQSLPITEAPACCLESPGDHCYTFSALGQDVPLLIKPVAEEDPTGIAGELNLPAPIRRRALGARINDYYGKGKSLQIWIGGGRRRRGTSVKRRLIPAEEIIVADLSGWQFRPRDGLVAVDPELGRISFPKQKNKPTGGVWVSYHYGAAGDLGGGEYDRPLSQPDKAQVYRVGRLEDQKTISAALELWRANQPEHAVIEITDSGIYSEQLSISLPEGTSLQLRAGNRCRPIIRLLDWKTDLPDDLVVNGGPDSRLCFDGLLISGRGVLAQGQLGTFTIRHCTLVPGWTIGTDCNPRRPTETSLELIDTSARLAIEHSIVGSIQISQDQVMTDPTPLRISDSVVDACGRNEVALGCPDWPVAHATLTIERSTVIGALQPHTLELADSSIFIGKVTVARSQVGCVRFCYVTPGSHTPQRFNCQPDLVEHAVAELANISDSERATLRELEQVRVSPRFVSTSYGTAGYCVLAATCAEEIRRGADDESEMGIFHDLFQPQREANLRARLEEYTPAGMQAGPIFET
jgi:hypothetical protein